MNTLHTLNASAREHGDLFARLLRSATAGDTLLLLENGVYNLSDANALQAIADAGLTLFALQADIVARGLAAAGAAANSVDDDGFVALACSHRKVVSWFA